jgi:hypothetical protein
MKGASMTNVARIELFRNAPVERPDNVRTTWQEVNPEYATKVLDAYEKFCDEHPDERMNRPVHQSQVNKYAADMKAGRWGRHHQGIAFDKNGVLMDGQHRLWAVIESASTVMMPVTYGLDREAQLTIDSGLVRSTTDVAAIAGFDGVKPIHVGVVRAVVRGTSPTKTTYTRMEELEMLREHWKAIDFVVSNFPKQKMAGLSRAPVMGAIARAYYTQDHAKLQRFIEVIISGITQDPTEHVIIVLRNWLLSATKKAGGSLNSLEAYGKTARALQAYIRGEKIRTLYAATQDIFALPALRSRR